MESRIVSGRLGQTCSSSLGDSKASLDLQYRGVLLHAVFLSHPEPHNNIDLHQTFHAGPLGDVCLGRMAFLDRLNGFPVHSHNFVTNMELVL